MVMKIIAIGGGEIGRPGFPVETTAIDKEIIRLSGKRKPKLLFIPTASGVSSGYAEVVKKHFGKRLGCKIVVLNVIREKHTKKELESKVFSSSIVYVGGGNTLTMMKRWKKIGLDKILKKAAEKGIVLSGVSAGAICWFRWGNSDSRKFKNPKADYIKVSGLGFINALCCPHYNKGPTYISKVQDRVPSLKRMMRKTPGVAIALDNCTALEVIGEKARIIASKKNANAHKVYWKKEKYFKEKLPKNKFFQLEELVSK